jgi:leader peptidase (prepilin peptidase)/N-methyltransferase
MTGVLTALVALVGAVVGSFLNVCIYRLPRGESIIGPRSKCATCSRTLEWFENVPLIAYVALRGRCRTCHSRIGRGYPVVEATTAVMFVAAWWYYEPSALLLSRLLFGCALIVLFAIDLEHHVLPNAITLPGILVGLAFSVVTEPGWLSSAVGVLAGGGILYAVAEAYYRLRREEGLGMGDVKMLAMIGAFLGWQLALVTLMMASFAGSVVGLLLIAAGRGTMKYALPFGTFLAAGAAAAVVVGPNILDWYVALW